MSLPKIFFLNHLSSYINSLADALCQLGHNVYYQSSWNMREVEAGIAYFKPDVLITVGIDKPMFDPSIDVIPELCQKYGLLHIYWATEDRIHHNKLSLPIIRRLKPDVVWTIHPDCVALYKALGLQSSYLNFAFNPRMFPPKSEATTENYDISFIGTTHLDTRTFRYESLKQLLFPLIKAGFETNVWGYSWMENKKFLEAEFGASVPPHLYHGYLPYKKTSDIYQHSKIVLGVQNALDQVSQRTFEILGTGAFTIASRTTVLEQLFEDRKEIVLTTSAEETVELVSYYMGRPEERLKIGRRARMKVLANHRFDLHLSRILPLIDQLLQKRRRARRW